MTRSTLRQIRQTDPSDALEAYFAARLAQVDAVVVPAARPSEHLETAIDLAARLDAYVVLVCSRWADTVEATARCSRRVGLNWIVIRLEPSYRHELFEFSTSMVQLPGETSLGDLSLKRNIGLALARIVGWRRIFFLDDDIREISVDKVADAAAALETCSIAGLRSTRYPDNSVVRHAYRLTGRFQSVSLSGSALLVDCGKTQSFFPDMYNEDWFFMYDNAEAGATADAGQVMQLKYRPFANPELATLQEFGDVLAEAIYTLLKRGLRISEALQPDFWRQALSKRKKLISETSASLSRQARQTGDNSAPNSAILSLEKAELRHNQISVDLCVQFIKDWRADSEVWTRRYNALPRHKSVVSALRLLFACRIVSLFFFDTPPVAVR
jgi:hypothetical protein